MATERENFKVSDFVNFINVFNEIKENKVFLLTFEEIDELREESDYVGTIMDGLEVLKLGDDYILINRFINTMIIPNKVLAQVLETWVNLFYIPDSMIPSLM